MYLLCTPLDPVPYMIPLGSKYAANMNGEPRVHFGAWDSLLKAADRIIVELRGRSCRRLSLCRMGDTLF